MPPLKHRLVLVLCIVGAVALLAISASARQNVLQAISCPVNWYESPDPQIREQCARAKQATMDALDRLAATEALLNPTSAPPTQPILTPSPIGYIASVPTSHALPPAQFADGPPILRGSNSIWFVGQLTTADPVVSGDLYLLARPPEDGLYAHLATALYGTALHESDYTLYNHIWFTPQDIGMITITGVTGPTTSPQGPTGTVAFTTTTGASGTFDLATHTWSITAAGTPVVPPPPSIPNVTPTVETSPTPEAPNGSYPAP